MKRLLSHLLLIAVLLAAAAPSWSEDMITVYKTAGCGCCEQWVEYLRAEGFKVTAVDKPDLAAIKRSLGVQPAYESCHTAVVDGYVIEGHVPAGPIRRLLAERPATRGLAVPGMPTNSPGMGRMDGTLQTYTLEGKVYSTD
jgi:hypothetical protein